MKKKLPLSTNSSFYPPSDNNPNGPAGLDWVTLGIEESLAAICLFLNKNDITKVYILTGTLTISGGNYSYTGGYVYYAGDGSGLGKGEIFAINPIPSTTMSGHSYLNVAVDSSVSGADPVTYSDTTQRSPHVYRTLTFTPANAPSAGAYATPAGAQAATLPYGLITTLPDATLWVPLNQPQMTTVGGGGGAPAFGTGFASSNGLKFNLDAFGKVTIQGDFSVGTYSQAIVFVPPNNIMPTNNVYGTWYDNSGNTGSITIFASGGNRFQVNGMTVAQNGKQIQVVVPGYYAAN